MIQSRWRLIEFLELCLFGLRTRSRSAAKTSRDTCWSNQIGHDVRRAQTESDAQITPTSPNDYATLHEIEKVHRQLRLIVDR